MEPWQEEDMLSGLNGQEKMSKSDPNSAIYMEDEEVSWLEIYIYIYCRVHQ